MQKTRPHSSIAKLMFVDNSCHDFGRALSEKLYKTIGVDTGKLAKTFNLQKQPYVDVLQIRFS